jgi:hypothetical protein
MYDSWPRLISIILRVSDRFQGAMQLATTPMCIYTTVEGDLKIPLPTSRSTPPPRDGHGQVTSIQSSGSEGVRERYDKSMPWVVDGLSLCST